jgi:para-aminobenzoate synthetase component 1
LTKINHLKEIAKSNKSFIIYKSDKGFDLYTDFSKKIILTNGNIKNFIKKATQFKFKKKDTDIFIGFFGYEILNNLIGVKVKKQKGLKFPKRIFYKTDTKVKLQNNLDYKNLELINSNKSFKININKASYKVIFD